MFVCVCELFPEEKAEGHQIFVGDLGVQGVITIYVKRGFIFCHFWHN